MNIPKNYRLKAEVYIIDGDYIYAAKTKYGFHTLPGGGIDKGETPKMAAQRECIEEIGISIKNIKPIGNVNPLCLKFDKSPMFYGDYDGTCIYSFIAQPDKKVGKGIEEDLKLDIIELDEMINSLRKALLKYQVGWWKKLIANRIAILTMIMDDNNNE